MASLPILRALSQLPVAMTATRLSKTPLRASACRDECPVTTLETTRPSSTPLDSLIRDRLMRTRNIQQAAVVMWAMLDKGPTVLSKGDTMTVGMLDIHELLTRQRCRLPVLHRTAQDRPVTNTSTLPRPRANVHITLSSTACPNRRPSRT